MAEHLGQTKGRCDKYGQRARSQAMLFVTNQARIAIGSMTVDQSLGGLPSCCAQEAFFSAVMMSYPLSDRGNEISRDLDRRARYRCRPMLRWLCSELYHLPIERILVQEKHIQ